MTGTGDLERRVSLLEDAVKALRGNASAVPVAVPEDTGSAVRPVLDPETFWALAGLRSRLPEGGGAVLFAGVVNSPAGGVWEWQEAHPDTELMAQGWEDAGTGLAALASPIRMALLREVLHGHGTAAELAAMEGFGTSGQVYHHLRQLTAAGWLRAAGRGHYAVPPERVVPLLTIVAASRR